jgi:hypothetical protein
VQLDGLVSTTFIVVIVVVTLVAGNGHTIHALDRIAGGLEHILVSVGARVGGRMDNINLSDVDANMSNLCAASGGVACQWMAVTFGIFVSAGCSAR